MVNRVLLPLLLLYWALGEPYSTHTRQQAWFELGHRLVADIAESRLSSPAAAAIRDLLAGQSMADASVWADQIRGERRNTSSLHFVNIPLLATTYDPARDCPAGRCIIVACDSFARVLADPHAARLERAEALRFLLHLVADLHQPLHVADNKDRGGNLTQVRLGEVGSNLHKVWDGQMLERLRAGKSAHMDRLQQRMATLKLAQFEGGTTVDWAMEGHALAQRLAYNTLPGQQVENDYVQAGLEASDLALIKAGVRLAAMLNHALASYKPGGKDAALLPPGTYSDAEAIAHIGETANVVGTVVSVRTSRRGNTFLNFGRDYPHQTFTVVLLDPNHPAREELSLLKGRKVSVRGQIRLYKGQPEIVIKDPAQVAPVGP